MCKFETTKTGKYFHLYLFCRDLKKISFSNFMTEICFTCFISTDWASLILFSFSLASVIFLTPTQETIETHREIIARLNIGFINVYYLGTGFTEKSETFDLGNCCSFFFRILLYKIVRLFSWFRSCTSFCS